MTIREAEEWKMQTKDRAEVADRKGKERGVGRGKKVRNKGGILKGKMVSICGPTCLEWYVADFAFLLMGMINVSNNGWVYE